MKKIRKEKVLFFEKVLLDFFHKVGREHLPWRKKNITAYEVWVSEIMLQQTQVSRVILYYTKFLRRFPNVEALAQSSWEEFLPYYEGLGYYNRGRNMLRAAQEVVVKYQGKFPRDAEALRRLPGIGPYTAAAIMSFAYGDNHLAWDTNVRRVIGRFFCGGKQLVSDEVSWESLFEMPKKKMNAALMDFGSALCLARPKCEACPLRRRCVYQKEKGLSERQFTLKSTTKQKQVIRGPKQVRTWVFLHENHRKYFSPEARKYVPFMLPRGYDSRKAIKDWFREHSGLSVSVRPPHRNLIMKSRTIIFVNAQILSGQHTFFIFSKKDFQSSVERLIKG